MTLRGFVTALAGLAAVSATAISTALAGGEATGTRTMVCITNPDAPKDIRSRRLMMIGPGDRASLERELKRAGAFTVPGPTGEKDLSTIRDVIGKRVVDGVAFTDTNVKMRKSDELPAGHPAFLIGDMAKSKAMHFVYNGARSAHVGKDGYPYFDVGNSVLMNCTALDDKHEK